MTDDTLTRGQTMNEPTTDVWAVVELMGHVKLAGRLSEEERFGAKMGRLEIPAADGGFVTQHFGGGSVYRITYVTEEVARHIAKAVNVAPLSRWDFPQQTPALTAAPDDSMPYDEFDEEEADDVG